MIMLFTLSGKLILWCMVSQYEGMVGSKCGWSINMLVFRTECGILQSLQLAIMHLFQVECNFGN